MIDEFSWFVGFYEGEGTVTSSKSHGTKIVIRIRNTDYDNVLRSSKFLGVKPLKVSRIRKDGTKKEYIPDHYKDMWEVTKSGGSSRGKLFNLLKKMRPHLSSRRQQQIDETIEKARSRSKKI